MRLAALLVTISCACSHRAAPVAPAPAPLENRVAATGPTLDDLRFLAGCWQFYSVDYGFRVCWEQRTAGWVGRWQTLGPMANERNIVLSIAPLGGRIEMTAIPSVDWFEGIEHVELTSTRGNAVTFGTAARGIGWVHSASDDTLALIVRTRRYELRRIGD